MQQLYRFRPVEKHLIWGRESWQLSGVAGSETTVLGGPEDGTILSELIARHGAALVGRPIWREYGNEMPLLFKFIYADRPLSIQVHPDDAYARAHGLPRGKAEMWYALPSAPEAMLYAGLKADITPEGYKRMVADGSITEALASHSVREGDVFYLPAGRIHSLGAGCRVAEIQQSSDTTYRIYDFGRLGPDGRPRQLHLQEASEAIDYHVHADYRSHYLPAPAQPVTLVDCPYFSARLIDNRPDGGEVSLDCGDEFVVFMNAGGHGTITTPDGKAHDLIEGHSVLVPAATPRVVISGKVAVLEARPH